MSEAHAARTPEEIRRDIEHTREELADTAAALAEKADVRARAHEKLDEAKSRITGKVATAKAKVTAGAGTAGGTAVEATPSPVTDRVQDAAGSVAAGVRANPLPPALIAGFVAGVLIGRARRPA